MGSSRRGLLAVAVFRRSAVCFWLGDFERFFLAFAFGCGLLGETERCTRTLLRTRAPWHTVFGLAGFLVFMRWMFFCSHALWRGGLCGGRGFPWCGGFVQLAVCEFLAVWADGDGGVLVLGG